MRIIAGQYKGTNLFSVPGQTTRPTTDYTREVIFSTLFDVEGCKVLDLYSGSGALALEALSRGAESAVMIDGSEKAFKVIRQNIEKLKCQDRTFIQKNRVDQYIKKCKEKYDLILLDPPYDKDLVNPTLFLIFEHGLCEDNCTIVAEHTIKEPLHPYFHKFLVKTKQSGKTVISFLEIKAEGEIQEEL